VPAIQIAAAQCPSIAGNIEHNIHLHLQIIDAAIQQGIELLVFPELSLTGYELAFSERCKLKPSDSRLAPFRQRANQHRMTIVVGAPIDIDETRPALGAIIFSPYGVSTYFKQHLHGAEQQFFLAGPAARPIRVKDLPVSLAICADTNQPSHAQAAADAGAHIYAAGVMFSDAGYGHDCAQLQRYASGHGMAVLMANHCAPTGGLTAAGGSTVWGPDGMVLGQAAGKTPALVIARQKAQSWEGQVMPLTLTPLS